MDKTKAVYREAASSGKYEKVTGLLGKYDNVRRYWEDELTRITIRPYLESLIREKLRFMERLRILDLGCGSGDGFELLSDVSAREPSLIDYQVNLISPEILGIYRGVDISEPLLEQAREYHGINGKMTFEIGDFSQGLPVEQGDRPYDIYFTSYGTLSHLKDEQLVELLADIAGHSGRHAILICDWLGRYSYEWQELWELEEEADYTMDYVVSYIYQEEERAGKELDHLILRLMSPREVNNLVDRASSKAGREIKPLLMFDRSIFVGRHVDTGDYNRHCQPLRTAVNSLFETNVRTNLETLIADYHPLAGFDEINSFYEKYQMSWNALVQYTIDLLYHYDSQALDNGMPEIPECYPDVVREMMQYLKNIVESCHWIRVGDTRANIIEPQLGYALRELELKTQRGMGCGHGLVGVYVIKK
ncbi:MAG: class I SAM-dependent methyltransferase [Actinomycetota bacterium]|nr:class I SAM-dependent methyltransferase [Actinomycetota bacterium]